MDTREVPPPAGHNWERHGNTQGPGQGVRQEKFCVGSGQTFACGFQCHPTWNTILIKPGSYALGQVFSSKQRYSGTICECFPPHQSSLESFS